MENKPKTERVVGTVVRGLRAPIIREGDDLRKIVVDVVLNAMKHEGFAARDRDIVCVTEAVVARAQGNYATVDQIATDVRDKFGGDTVGVIFPILSRNRFAICLRGIARGSRKVVLMLSYPSDEVGNHLVSIEKLDEAGIDPYHDVLTQKQFEQTFGKSSHAFTGIDYVNYYREIIAGEGCEAEIVFSNNPRTILNYTSKVLACDIHSRQRTKRLLKNAGVSLVLGLDNLLTEPVNGSGYNSQYGLLGSNKASDDSVKLFPGDCTDLVLGIQQDLIERTGKQIEAMIYGDGAFKDPAGKIWELADPVVSPCFTPGLEGRPNELKLKYLADNDFKHLSGEALQEAISERIRMKEENSGNEMSEGTTPRHLPDLIGSLCDLTSGSGDKGTPIVYIQGYFDNYTI